MATRFDGLLGRLRMKDKSTANEVLPSQTGNNGKYLKTDGSNSSWATVTAGGVSVPEVTTDPVSPVAGDVWVLRTDPATDGTAGVPRGLLLALTYAGVGGASTYQLSFRTEAATTVRSTIS
jgi:hypothetical protein